MFKPFPALNSAVNSQCYALKLNQMCTQYFKFLSYHCTWTVNKIIKPRTNIFTLNTGTNFRKVPVHYKNRES